MLIGFLMRRLPLPLQDAKPEEVLKRTIELCCTFLIRFSATSPWNIYNPSGKD
jgi:hypothetical protein